MAYNIHINTYGQNIPVWDRDAPSGQRTQVGTLLQNELFNRLYAQGERDVHAYRIHFYSPTGPRFGTIYTNPEAGGTSAAYTTHTADSITDIGQTFRVRRRCRIFRGTSRVEYIYSGDRVVIPSNNNSQGGESHPYRLYITGYIKNGVYHSAIEHGASNLWCDTDYEIGYSMGHQVTTYSTRW
ncbi:hypothetical protein [Virgibacillus kimchii]